jgi:hypothetical protein
VLENVVIVDNAIPLDIQLQLEEVCLHAHFPWHYHPTSAYNEEESKLVPDSYKKDSVDTPFFGHVLYDNHTVNSSFFSLFTPVVEAIPDIESSTLLRFKLNLTMSSPNTNNNTHSFPHTDLGKAVNKYTTAIYYVNNSSGDTFIFNNDLSIQQRIEPRRGRLVVFDGNRLHAGNNPRQDCGRVVANINITPKLEK